MLSAAARLSKSCGEVRISNGNRELGGPPAITRVVTREARGSAKYELHALVSTRARDSPNRRICACVTTTRAALQAARGRRHVARDSADRPTSVVAAPCDATWKKIRTRPLLEFEARVGATGACVAVLTGGAHLCIAANRFAKATSCSSMHAPTAGYPTILEIARRRRSYSMATGARTRLLRLTRHTSPPVGCAKCAEISAP